MNSPSPLTDFSQALIVLPRISVQNANCISSPLTWGFPAITAFAGLCTALERRLGGAKRGIVLKRFGVVCHSFEPQINQDDYGGVRFSLTRNPVQKDGSSAAIVEEGRAHMQVSLLFETEVDTDVFFEDALRQKLLQQMMDELATMRIAGGSVLPRLQNDRPREKPRLMLSDSDDEKIWRRIRADLSPGFALVSRDDLLRAPLDANEQPGDALSVWLDRIALIHRANPVDELSKASADVGVGTAATAAQPAKTIEWRADTRTGWTVPIPVGYASIAPLQAAGSVANARDPRLPFQFVESVYSIGQWVSPHRLGNPADFMWQALPPDASGVYRCVNTNRFSTPTAARSNARDPV